MFKNLFMVTCAGMSGSKWLASLLSKHPQFSCSHSAGLHMIYERNYTDKEIIEILEIERKQFSGEIRLDHIFNQLEKEGAIVNGNVHAFRLYRLKEAIEKSATTPLFRLANLVRHPVDVTLSRAAMFYEMVQHDASVKERIRKSFEENQNLWHDVVAKYNLDIQDFHVLCFLDAVLGMKKLSDEIRLNPDVKHVRLESLNNAVYLRDLFSFLSDNRVDTTLEMAEKLVSLPAINAHNMSHSSKTHEKYLKLESWQKDVFTIGFRESKIIVQYEKLGYSFDFLTVKASEV